LVKITYYVLQLQKNLKNVCVLLPFFLVVQGCTALLPVKCYIRFNYVLHGAFAISRPVQNDATGNQQSAEYIYMFPAFYCLFKIRNLAYETDILLL